MGKADDFMKGLSNSYLGNRVHDLDGLIKACKEERSFSGSEKTQVQMHLEILRGLFIEEINSRKGANSE